MVNCLWWSSRASEFLAHIETTYFKDNFTMVVSVRLAKNTQGYSTTEYL